MRRKQFAALVMILLVMTSCQNQERSPLEVRLYNADKDAVGTAKFNELEGKVEVQIKVESLEPGFHGVHIHEYAKCDGPDFESAGNHLNPEGKEHGDRFYYMSKSLV